MYMLVKAPSGGTAKEAFDVLDEVFGTGEFTDGQAVNSIALGMDIDAGEARTLFNDMVRAEVIGEV